jgi:hypothetical protein
MAFYKANAAQSFQFSLAEYSAITAPSFDETTEFALSVALFDTRSLAGARNHCEGSVTQRKMFLPWSRNERNYHPIFVHCLPAK